MCIVWIGILVALSFISAQFDEGVLCTVVPAADSQALNVNVDDILGTRIGWVTSDCKRSLLGPRDLHWHVYSIDDDAEPRIYMSPPHLVQPTIARNGFLQFVLQDLAAYNYSRGDTLDGAGVILWLRASDLTTLEIVGVDTTVDITSTTADSAMTVTADGVDTTVRLTTPGAVRFISKSVDLAAHLELSSAASVIDLQGVKNRVSVRTSTNTSALLQASLSGVDTELELLHGGGYETIVVSGVKGRVVVGTDCTGVEQTGVGTQCTVDANYTTERVPEVSCLVSNINIVNIQACFGLAFDGSILLRVGLGILVVVLVVVAVIARRRRGSHLLPSTIPPVQAQPTTVVLANAGDALPPMAIAEVVADGTPVDPHLVTSKLDDDAKKCSS